MLLQAVKRELRLVVDEDFEGLQENIYSLRSVHIIGSTHVSHELLTCHTNVLRQRGTEHHDLLVMRGDPEDFLYVAAHVCRSSSV